jgi:hypothetical protein
MEGAASWKQIVPVGANGKKAATEGGASVSLDWGKRQGIGGPRE